jgi:trans-AT polyketide synthase, acyltransferase and oxidoreductase domains
MDGAKGKRAARGCTPMTEAPLSIEEAVRHFRRPLAVLWDRERVTHHLYPIGDATSWPSSWDELGRLPPVFPEWLGCRGFLDAHGVRFAYVAGAMARGIATSAMVVALAEAGMLGFYGAAGLAPPQVEMAISEIEGKIGGAGLPWGVDLIHSPQDPMLENALVDLYLRRGVQRVSASAFMGLTPAIIRYAARGLKRRPNGAVARHGHVFAKVSRPEVAVRFMTPPPSAILRELAASGAITEAEADLAALLPVAEDITAEADSGGHTDNQPLPVLLPLLMAVRERVREQAVHDRPVRIGAAGGLGTPPAVAAAFAMGAAYVLTGSVNQSVQESGLSPAARGMLDAVGPGDVAMAPAADMFELGARVQVVRKGTVFAQRARRLHELYRAHPSLDEIPAAARARLEREVFRRSLAEVWEETRRFFAERDAAELARAEADPKRQMALVFRWYLGLSSRWAIEGVADRRVDYQIWCGPAMAAFNAWVAGSFLADPARRTVVQVALNLMEGAAAITRAQQLRCIGVDVPDRAFTFEPRPLR